MTLSFRLTRAADVTATVVRSGSTVRTMRLGRLAAGARTVDWDGKLGGGGVATSGAYSLKVSADGSLGVTEVAQALTVDLAAPKLTAPATASVAYRKTAKLAYTVRDAFSAVVKVSATITNAKGVVVATVPCGWVKQGVSHDVRLEAEGATDVHRDVPGDGPGGTARLAGGHVAAGALRGSRQARRPRRLSRGDRF